MSVIKILKQVSIKVMKKQNNIFTVDVNKQKQYLSKIKEPKNDAERSYYQYRCQCFLKGKITSFAQNTLGIFLLVFYSIKYKKNANAEIAQDNCDAVFIHEDKPTNILPYELKDLYKNIRYNFDASSILEPDDIRFLKKICKGRIASFFFVFRCMNDIAEYAAIIKKYNPKAIITCSEYSFTSSILTAYCEMKKVKHIDVMHGEKLFYIRDSFFRFNSCYIWDMHYKDLFVKMKAYENQFIISVPESLSGKIDERSEKKYEYIYYLGAEDNEQLETIYNLLHILEKKCKKKICVRPHPRYSNMELVNNIFNDFSIENAKCVTIEESLSRTSSAISLYSTVLLQAYYKGIDIVIDDITCNEMYDQLIKLDYIILNKKHHLLSDIIRKEE